MEKVYQTMKHAGITNIVLGTLVIVIGALCGSFIIVNGAKLLSRKNDILF
ncbi:MAG: hypothetical protein LUE23_10095 [Lachnospiraceae bacterium]|nr:hypothetical protein [Lachnospiraceae bacterium]MCD8125356.1 hypothetical protein [Lachnospiraceae bacterium]